MVTVVSAPFPSTVGGPNLHCLTASKEAWANCGGPFTTRAFSVGGVNPVISVGTDGFTTQTCHLGAGFPLKLYYNASGITGTTITIYVTVTKVYNGS